MRLATGAGHSVRVVQTPTSLQLRGQGDLRGRDRRARARRRVRARSRARRVPRGPRAGSRARSPTSSWSGAATCSASPRPRPTPSPSSPAGIADNLLTSAALACTAPLVLAPAMNDRMFEHPATQENLERLRARGARIVPPGTGRLASKGEWGTGRLAEPADILAAIEAALEPAPVRAALARRAARARHGRRHARADRLGALRGQPLVGTDGPRAGRGGRPAWRRGHADLRERGARAPGAACACVDVTSAAELEAAARAEFPDGRRAADGGGGGRLPPERARRTPRS